MFQEHPVVDPQVVHLRQVPLRTMVMLPQSGHMSPVKPISRARDIWPVLLCMALLRVTPATGEEELATVSLADSACFPVSDDRSCAG